MVYFPPSLTHLCLIYEHILVVCNFFSFIAPAKLLLSSFAVCAAMYTHNPWIKFTSIFDFSSIFLYNIKKCT